MNTNEAIKIKVLKYLEAHPASKRAEMAKETGLSLIQVGNALAYWRLTNQATPSGRGRATTWTATN